VLLDHYYATGEPLPAEETALMRICRAFEDHERAAVTAVARLFFPVNGDGKRHNKRADKQLVEMAEKQTKLSEAGKRGMAKRWQSDTAKQVNKVVNNEAIAYPHPHPHPHPKPEPKARKNTSCSEVATATPSQPIIFSVPLIPSHGEFGVTAVMVAEWESCFPNVDVEQTLREIRAWSLANPTKRKTKSGAMRFITAWMQREQNKGG